MGNCCHDKGCALDTLRGSQSRVLTIVMAINIGLFLTEIVAGYVASSSSLMADSLDSLGDALVYAFSLYVLYRSAQWRVVAALIKGIIMLGFGIAIIATLVDQIISPILPIAPIIGVFGVIALCCNLSCLLMLTKHRSDDINMESVWLCSRNDIIANIGVIIASVGVELTGTMWPDVVVGTIIAVIFLRSAGYVLSQASKEYGRLRIPS